MEKDSGTVFRELKEDVSAYVELKLELLKLSTYERTGKVIAVLSYGLVLLFLAFFAILFIFLALGFFLGDWLGSSGFGFGIVAVLYLLLIGIIIMNRDRISTKVLNEVIAAMTANDDKNNATNDEQPANPTGETDLQENAGSLLLSGLSSLLFPSNKSTTKTNDKNTAPVTAGQPSIALGISDYLSIAKGMIPIAWDLAQPFIMTWGIKKAKKWFSNLLFKKKK